MGDSTIRDLKPRIAPPKPKCPELILYTDAETLANTISAVLFEPSTFLRRRRVLIAHASTLPEEWHKARGPTSLIEGMGMLSDVSFIIQHGARLAGKSVAVYVDNNYALSSLIRGSAKSEALANIVQMFWFYVQKYDIKRWLERVPSTRNIADLPTRNQLTPFRRKRSLNF